MISVIIPALNEAERVGLVVRFALLNPKVTEVIVIDDGSIDGTPELAASAGATVVMSTLLGKGASMHDGLLAAQNDVLLYLDGDLDNLDINLISRMTDPIFNEQADFVKAQFERSAGRVTTLTARPLIQTFFPELKDFAQPLGGIIAARRSLLEKLHFENDYGVDVGLLLDAAQTGALITQVDIGRIDHDSQPLNKLGDMATQVLRVILDRAARYGRLSENQIREVCEVERITQAALPVILKTIQHSEQLALFDMDGVILKGRFIAELASKTGKIDELSEFLDHPTLDDSERTQAIASLFAGTPKAIFEQTARHIPLIHGVRRAIIGLRKMGYKVGIVTDSFFVASEIVRRRVFADFSIAHVLRFRDDRATGEVTISPPMLHPGGCATHKVCKLNAMLHLTEQMQLDPQHVIAVGDGNNDVCLLRAVGHSFAFQPKTAKVRSAAKRVLEHSLLDLLDLIGNAPQRA